MQNLVPLQNNQTEHRFIRCFFEWSKFYAWTASTTRKMVLKSAEEIYQLEQMGTLNEQQIFAEENILDGHNIVLTGQAGTDKTCPETIS